MHEHFEDMDDEDLIADLTEVYIEAASKITQAAIHTSGDVWANPDAVARFYEVVFRKIRDLAKEDMDEDLEDLDVTE